MDLQSLIKKHNRRSPRSIWLDNNINARKQFKHTNKKGVKYWLRYPAQCDIIGVDNIKSNTKVYKRKKRKPNTKTYRKPKVVITRKKTKPKAIFTITKRSPFVKSKLGYSKSRKMQMKYRLTDPYEKKMVERIRRKSGLTYIQAVNLFKKSRNSDFDIECGLDIGGDHGDRREKYSYLSSQLSKEKDVTKKSIRDLMAENSMMGF